MKKLLWIALCFVSLTLHAQVDRLDSLLSDLIYDDIDLLDGQDAERYDFVYLGTAYSNRTFYAGREVGDGMMNQSWYAYYYGACGLFAGASGAWYDGLTPAYSSTSLSVGYGGYFSDSKRVAYRFSYSRYLYHDEVVADESLYQNNINVGLSYRKGWFGARGGVNYLFGDEQKLGFYGALYSRLKLAGFGAQNALFMVPEVSAFVGKEWVNVTRDGQLVYDELYGLMNTQVIIPLEVSLGNFDVEVSGVANFPFTRDELVSYPASLYLMMSVGYVFGF
ncbi:hypothetical protein LX69_02691 [Breznakibacter xylanolyticus]|uniref:Outer membrane protein with beta-barrel domain n=1 Tax=Breznakibacter xylanolyticus TaxID=990 RepID=A0A2W7MZ69_9BACT|nr:hypothetical protein [Breznakibacter xylanolyticus]PZX13435.1 hypothetical protein LX69_02691 [Breznakibacter xylanolyticus]